MNSYHLPNVCVFWNFVVFIMLFLMLSRKPLCSTVLLPFSAIPTNLILFVFHVSNTTGLLFTVKPLCNLSSPLSVQHHLGVLCAWWNTHTMAVLHHGWYNFTKCCIALLYFHFQHIVTPVM